jgi:broad specificity phosphatase PhoE
MHVLLLRHGQTDENARGILQGHSQTNLNQAGREQARRLAGRLRAFRPRVEALVSSDLNRAVQTAEALEVELGLRAARLETWRERGFGPWEGKEIGQAETWRAATGNWDLPGAEDTDLFRARVRAALLDVVRAHADLACVGVVTHGAVIRTVLTLLNDGVLGVEPGTPMPEPAPIVNCSILQLRARRSDTSDPFWSVLCVNDAAHLGDEALAEFRVEG